MSEKPTYVMGFDDTVKTHDRDGVVEHKHAGIEYWHPAGREHDGCGRTDDGVDSDVRICLACDCVNHLSMCHARRRQLGLVICNVEHYVSGMTRTNRGIDEHIHDGYKRWHSVGIMHFGCRRVEDGTVIDSIMCGECSCSDTDYMECIGMRYRRGMNQRGYFSHERFAISDKCLKSVDRAETLVMIDEAVAELVSAKSMLDRVRRDSNHVLQEDFGQFIRYIDEVVTELIIVSRLTEKDMEEARNGNIQ